MPDPNNSFILRLGRGQKPNIHITLHKRGTPTASGGDSQPEQSARKDMMLLRRPTKKIIPRKSGEFISIYDMGQVKSGSVWVNNDLTIQPVLTLGGTITQTDMNSGDWDDIRDNLLARPRAEYYKLPSDEIKKYGFDLYLNTDVTPVDLDGPTNTPKGIKFPDPITRIIFSHDHQGISYNFDTDNTDDFKITATASYAADPVTISAPDKKLNIYLAPSIGEWRGVGDNAEVDGMLEQNGSGYYYNVFPREALDIAGGSWFNETEGSLNNTSIIDEYENILELNPLVQYVHVHDAAGTPLFTPGGPISFRELLNIRIHSPVPRLPGSLIAIIENDSNHYYVWRDNSDASLLADFALGRTP